MPDKKYNWRENKNKTISLNNISDEMLHEICFEKYIQNEISEEFTEEKHELIKGVSIEKLRSAIRALTYNQRLAFELYVLRDYKQKKIALIMNCSVQNVSKTVLAACANIRKSLGK